MRHEPDSYSDQNKNVCQHNHLESRILFWALENSPVKRAEGQVQVT